jgi:hypothetical protein
MTWKKTPSGWHYPAPGFEVKVTESGGWYNVAVLHTETGTAYTPPAPFGDLSCACKRALNELNRMQAGEQPGGSTEDDKGAWKRGPRAEKPKPIAKPRKRPGRPAIPIEVKSKVEAVWFEIEPGLWAGEYKGDYLRCWKDGNSWLSLASDSPKATPYFRSRKAANTKTAKMYASQAVGKRQGHWAKMGRPKKQQQTETI